MKKVFHIVVLSIFITLLGYVSSQAQSGTSGWQLSVGGGFMNYYGDVSPYHIHKWKDWEKAFQFFQYNKHYVPEVSFGLSLEKRFTPGLGLMIQVNKGVLEMSDRYQKTSGDYDMNALHWDRALNFKTDLYDAGLALTFHADNGKLLRRKAFFSPYLFLGAGVTYFKVKGDLYDENGNPYDYTAPEVHPDGKYETNLRDLKTEKNKKYNNLTPYADLGVGLKFRLSKVVSLTVQTDINYSFSDYLDDVSGKYKYNYSSAEQAYAAHPGTNIPVEDKRGDDDGVNDFYIFNKAALQFSLGRGGHQFKAPVVYQPTRNQSVLLDEIQKGRSSKDKMKLQNAEDTVNTEEVTAANDTTGRMLKDTTESRLVTIDSVAGEVHQLRKMLRRSRFDHIDQGYIIKENKVNYAITDQEKKIKALESHAPLTEQDSVKLRKEYRKLKSLYRQRRAIKEARQQLRRRYANTPIVTEYGDSTKIMIYRDHQNLTTDSLSHFDAEPEFQDIQGVHYDTVETTDSSRKLSQKKVDTTAKRDSLEKVYQRKIDSLRKVNDSLRHRSPSHANTKDSVTDKNVASLQNIGRDSLQTAYDSLLARYREDSMRSDSQRLWVERKLKNNNAQLKKDSLRRFRLQKRIDSILNQSRQDSTNAKAQKKMTGETLQSKNERIEKDSLQNIQLHEKIDSLLTLYRKDSVNAEEQALLLKKRQQANRQQLKKDSLQRQDLQKRVDSLQELQTASLKKVKLEEDSSKGNIFQRVFHSNKRKKNKKRAQQDTIRRLQNHLSEEKEAIRRLNNSMRELKNQNDAYDDRLSDIKGDRGLQASYLRAAIDQMNRRNSNYGNAPSLSAPIVVPTGGRGNSNYDRRLNDIDKRLDSLQKVKEQIHTLKEQQRDTVYQQNAVDSTERRINNIHRQLDSLQRMKAENQKIEKQNALKRQVDSLNETILRLKEEGSTNKKEEIENAIRDFPVISTYFGTGSSSVGKEGISSLRPAAAIIKKYAGVIISLKGFTDATGSSRINKIIAQKRVDAVKEVLVNKYQIDASRIRIEPVTTSNSKGGSNPLNRRVDVTLEKK